MLSGPANPEWLATVKPGDLVMRLMAGQIPCPLLVSEVTDTLIHCGPWTFDRATGIEEDAELGWGVKHGRTGSYLTGPAPRRIEVAEYDNDGVVIPSMNTSATTQMIEVVLFSGDMEKLATAEAGSPEAAVLAAQTIWDDQLLAHDRGQSRPRHVGFYVDGKLVRMWTRRPEGGQ